MTYQKHRKVPVFIFILIIIGFLVFYVTIPNNIIDYYLTDKTDASFISIIHDNDSNESTMFQEVDIKKPSCVPNLMSISQPDLFHHVLTPCSDYKEASTVLRKDRTYAKIDEIWTHINALGFRNDEYSLEKGPSTIRIILIGDSYVYGYGLPLEETFYKRLEMLLNAHSRQKIEVWNIGVPSWATVIHYYVVRDRVLSYSPDYILLFLDESDYADNKLYGQMVVWNGTYDVGVRQNNLGEGMDYYEARLAIQESLSVGNYSEKIRKQVELQNFTLSHVERIHLLTKDSGIPLEVVIYPYATNKSRLKEEVVGHIYHSLENFSIDHITL